MKKINKRSLIYTIVIIFAVILFAVSMILQGRSYDKQIEQLSETYAEKQQEADNLVQNVDIVDEQLQKDKAFLEIMFDEIFTFHDIDEFDGAMQNAMTYNLSDRFIANFYDKSELNGGYADALLDVLCEYDSSELYLLERSNNIGYYVADVTLDTVKYNSSFRIILFIAIADSGDVNERIQSIIYYTTA